MDGRGGCCIARYATNGGAYDASKVDRIMLRFRPIAPKPSSVGSSSGGSSPDSKDSYVKTGRGRRRYGRPSSDKGSSRNKKRCSRKRRQPAASRDTIVERDAASSGDHRAVVTLPLLPETPELTRPNKKEAAGKNNNNISRGGGYGVRNAISEATGADVCFFPEALGEQPPQEVHAHATWLNFSSHDRAALLLQPMRKAEAWVTVECVTDTWGDSYALGGTDEERKRLLGQDACPGFLSDGLGRVTWTNTTFRQTVGHGEPGIDVAVWLVMKDQRTMAPLAHATAFTCRVRLQYITGGKEKGSLTLPCDVWRMDGGGFAWRLDVKAALSLGR